MVKERGDHMQRRDLEWRATALNRLNGRGQNTRAYYVIDTNGAEGGATFRVWRRTAATREAELLGEHPSLAMAKSSLPVKWRDTSSSSGLKARGFWESAVLPEDGFVNSRDS